MRTLLQPGPVHEQRIESFAGKARHLSFTVESGVSLSNGLTAPLAAAGFQAATLRFSGARVEPFRYVMPDHAKDASHVAYFSAPRSPAGATLIERANATFGFHLGRPFLHCHAAWIEPDGQRRGGHILNDETILASQVEVQAWGFDDLRIESAEDEETNFTLLRPSGASVAGANAILARVRPNEDITLAIETIARAHGVTDATIEGSVGSLVGTRFADGREVRGPATEVLITGGAVRDGVAAVDLISVDMAGRVHEGRISRGENPVCITFDLVLIRSATAPDGIPGTVASRG
jgi:predicted DNA-binding protein with PD1-like motif